MNDRKHKQHTPLCRERIAQALSEDETQAHRVLDARGREDAFLENAVGEGDVSKENRVEEPMAIEPPLITPDFLPTPDTPRPAPHIPLSDKDERDKHLSFEEVVAGGAPISYKDILNGNNFHDVVNAEQETYDEIESLPANTDNMV